MRKVTGFYLFITLFGLMVYACSSPAHSPQPALQSGPMVGSVEMKQATLWLQTKKPSRVAILYWNTSDSTSDRQTFRQESVTLEEHYNTAKITLDQLEPGQQYGYEVHVNGQKIAFDFPLRFKTQPLWQWRTDPPDFSLAMGSCLYINDPKYDRPGEPYGGEYHILERIAQKQPDLMLWLGDNVYYREVDFYSESQMAQRYRHARSIPEMQPLLAGAVHLAIWDDHDFGPNDSDRSYRMRDEALNIFKAYWPNPAFGTKETPGIFYRYKYSDTEFFMLDDRFYRAPNSADNSNDPFLGREQLNWLKNSLINSNATFKIIAVGNQVTNTYTGHEGFVRYEKRYAELIQFLYKYKIEGVLFLSGDRHFTELLKTERTDAYPLYEFTSSPLTSGTYMGIMESKESDNPLRVKGTIVYKTRNFGMIHVTGPRDKRQLRLETYDVDGRLLWEHTIQATELSF